MGPIIWLFARLGCSGTAYRARKSGNSLDWIGPCLAYDTSMIRGSGTVPGGLVSWEVEDGD